MGIFLKLFLHERTMVLRCYFIYNKLEILPSPKIENNKAIRIELIENNSLFMYVKAVPKTMVTFPQLHIL